MDLKPLSNVSYSYQEEDENKASQFNQNEFKIVFVPTFYYLFHTYERQLLRNFSQWIALAIWKVYTTDFIIQLFIIYLQIKNISFTKITTFTYYFSLTILNIKG